MKLAIFDIDGTLTETNKIDSECFIKAFYDSHRITDFETDWTKYQHVTDSGIVTEIFEKKLKYALSKKDFITFKKCFIENLEESADKNANSFAEIANAKVMLEELKLEQDWAIALATGCFYDSAEFKLKTAKINIGYLPMATADDAVSREEILQIAIKKSLDFYKQKEFVKIVSVGDGVWDVRTAKNLNIDFIGIASGQRADKLRQEGAKLIVENFKDYRIFLEYLNK